MWFSTSEHLLVTLYSFFMGIGLAVIYDVVKLTRIVFGICSYSQAARKLQDIRLPLLKKRKPKEKDPKGSALVFLMVLAGDLFYFILCGAGYSLFLFHTIRGHVRWYFLLSSVLGFFFHYFTLSKMNITLLEVLFFFAKCAILYLWEILLLPFRFIFRLVYRLGKYARKKLILPVWDLFRYRSAVRYTRKLKNSLKKDVFYIETDTFNTNWT